MDALRSPKTKNPRSHREKSGLIYFFRLLNTTFWRKGRDLNPPQKFKIIAEWY